jgi:hypothetical protein
LPFISRAVSAFSTSEWPSHFLALGMQVPSQLSGSFQN